MKIIYKKPVIWPLVRLAFPGAHWGQVLLTWGDGIYTSKPLSVDLLSHESVHIVQQKMSKLWGLVWWALYVFSSKFRLAQEIPAHQAQWKTICATIKDRNQRDRARRQLATFISGPIYNKMISFDEAYKLFL